MAELDRFGGIITADDEDKEIDRFGGVITDTPEAEPEEEQIQTDRFGGVITPIEPSDTGVEPTIPMEGLSEKEQALLDTELKWKSLQERLNKDDTSPVSRVYEAWTEAAGKEFEEPIGLSFESMKALDDLGVTSFTRKSTSIFQPLNDILISTGAAGLDTATRLLSAPFEGTIAAAGQLVEEFGGSKNRTVNDLHLFFEANAPAIATLPAGANTLAAKNASKVRKKLEKQLDESLKDIPDENVRQGIKDTILKEADGIVIDQEVLDQAAKKIGEMNLDQIESNALFTRKERANAAFLDAMAPIKTLAEKGAKGDVDLTPYINMRLAKGSGDTIIGVLEKGTITRKPDGDLAFNGKGLNDILDTLKGKEGDAGLFFAAKRDSELAKRDIPGSDKTHATFTAEERQEMLKLGDNNPEFQAAFDEYQKFNQRVLDFAEQSGVISKEQKKRFIEAGQSYVPFYRIAEDTHKGGSKVLANPMKRLKAFKGQKDNVNEIFDNIYRNTIMWTDLAIKNHAKKSVYEWIDNSPFSDTVTKLTPPMSKVKVVDKPILNKLKEQGVDFDLSDELVDALSFGQGRYGKNVDVIYEDGKRVFREINDPDLFNALQSLTPRELGFTERVLGGFSTTLRRGVVLTPEFMAKNAIRDTATAAIQSKNSFTPIVDTIRGMKSRIIQDDDYWEAMINGAGFSSTFYGEREATKGLQALYKRAGINPAKVLDTPEKLIGGLDRILSASEMGTRIAEFKTARTSGRTAREAAFEAREISTDFARKGAHEAIKKIANAVPFFNARIQGLSRGARAIKEDPVKVSAKAMAMVTIPSLYIYNLNKDNPDYQALPNWVKDNFWVMFNEGEGATYLIPKPFEWGAIFGTVPERMFEMVEQRHGKRFADSMLRVFGEQLSLSPIPQAIKPALEVSREEGFFTEAPIVPERLKGLEPSEQFDAFTSDALVEMARYLKEDTGVEMSPKVVQHLIRGYLGTMGQYMLSAADELVRDEEATGERPTKRLDEKFFTKAFRRDVPVKGSQYEIDFYELLTEARETVDTINNIVKEGRTPDIDKRRENMLALRKGLDSSAKTLSQISRVMRNIYDDPDMSADSKRKEIDELLDIRLQITRGTLEAVPEEILKKRGLIVP